MVTGKHGTRLALAKVFTSHAHSPSLPEAELLSLGAALASALESVHQQWPGLGLSDDVMVAALGQRLGGAGTLQALEPLVLPDLVLASACCEGDPRALQVFEREVLPRVRKSVARLNSEPEFIDEVLQKVRERLLLREGKAEPRLTQYAGRGPLVHWLRAAAVRTALNLHKQRAVSRAGTTSLRHAEQAPSVSAPESQLHKRQLRSAFKVAFQAALDTLTAEERELLRLSAIEGLSIDKLQARMGQHRSTMSRQLLKIREQLFARTRRQLIQQLGLVSRGEVRNVAGFVNSELELSLKRVLQRDEEL